DMFSKFRQSAGLPSATVQWGRWSEGMTGTLKKNDIDRMEQAGILPIDEKQAFASLENMIVNNVAVSAFVNINWHKYIDQNFRGAVPLVLSGLVSSKKPDEKITKEITFIQ